MTTSLLTLPLSSPIPGPTKRKRVLLLDVSAAKRELRAEALRKLGMEVDCACDISEARSWWRADLYNLVLIDMESEGGHLDRFCEDIRAAIPPQQVAFLVGKPAYLSQSPNVAATSSSQLEGDEEDASRTRPAHATDTIRDPGRPWGIMEASRRISAVRSVSAARSRAMRNRPTPPRDLEGSATRRSQVMSQLASELQKQELL
jgi:CheY-like chemotaxis protein